MTKNVDSFHLWVWAHGCLLDYSLHILVIFSNFSKLKKKGGWSFCHDFKSDFDPYVGPEDFSFVSVLCNQL